MPLSVADAVNVSSTHPQVPLQLRWIASHLKLGNPLLYWASFCLRTFYGTKGTGQPLQNSAEVLWVYHSLGKSSIISQWRPRISSPGLHICQLALLRCEYKMSGFRVYSLTQGTVTCLIPTGQENQGKTAGGWGIDLGEIGGRQMLGNRCRAFQLNGRNLFWMPTHLRLCPLFLLYDFMLLSEGLNFHYRKDKLIKSTDFPSFLFPFSLSPFPSFSLSLFLF